MNSLENSLRDNANRASLPNISRAVRFEDPELVEFDHGQGAMGRAIDHQALHGTQWHELEHVVEEPEHVGVGNHHRGGANRGISRKRPE